MKCVSRRHMKIIMKSKKCHWKINGNIGINSKSVSAISFSFFLVKICRSLADNILRQQCTVCRVDSGVIDTPAMIVISTIKLAYFRLLQTNKQSELFKSSTIISDCSFQFWARSVFCPTKTHWCQSNQSKTVRSDNWQWLHNFFSLRHAKIAINMS